MKQSADLTPEFNNTPQSMPLDERHPVTKERYEELRSQLSELRLVLELTPQGPVTSQVRFENDQRIAAEMAYIRSRLDKRRELKDRFNMAHDGPRGEHLYSRRKM